MNGVVCHSLTLAKSTLTLWALKYTLGQKSEMEKSKETKRVDVNWTQKELSENQY